MPNSDDDAEDADDDDDDNDDDEDDDDDDDVGAPKALAAENYVSEKNHLKIIPYFLQNIFYFFDYFFEYFFPKTIRLQNSCTCSHALGRRCLLYAKAKPSHRHQYYFSEPTISSILNALAGIISMT